MPTADSAVGTGVTLAQYNATKGLSRNAAEKARKAAALDCLLEGPDRAPERQSRLLHMELARLRNLVRSHRAQMPRAPRGPRAQRD